MISGFLVYRCHGYIDFFQNNNNTKFQSKLSKCLKCHVDSTKEGLLKVVYVWGGGGGGKRNNGIRVTELFCWNNGIMLFCVAE